MENPNSNNSINNNKGVSDQGVSVRPRGGGRGGSKMSLG